MMVLQQVNRLETTENGTYNSPLLNLCIMMTENIDHRGWSKKMLSLKKLFVHVWHDKIWPFSYPNLPQFFKSCFISHKLLRTNFTAKTYSLNFADQILLFNLNHFAASLDRNLACCIQLGLGLRAETIVPKRILALWLKLRFPYVHIFNILVLLFWRSDPARFSFPKPQSSHNGR